MFRKPRESVTSSTLVEPSTGRPPTPPNLATTRDGMESPQAPVPKTAMPLLGRSKVTPRMTGKSIASPGGRASDKPNSSILSFFKKTQTSSAKEGLKQEEESLFIDDGEAEVEVEGLTQTPTPPGDFESENDLYKSRAHATPMDDSFRHNEISGSNKRRRLSTESDLFAPSKVPKPGVHITSDPLADKPDDKNNPSSPIKTEPAATPKQPSFALQCDTDIAVAHAKQEAALKGSGCTRAESPAAIPSVPTLKREPTSRAEGLEYNEGDDFIDDEYTEGEEYMERRWMEEQAELEVGLEDDDEQGGVPLEIAKQEDQMGDSGADRAQTAATCPICEGSFGNMSEQDASKHVNDCLDGKASALLKPGALANIVKPTELKQEVPNHKRFQRAAIAKPGQENPFGLAAGEAGGSSAFSRLMSGHAEDAAWAMAAATEASSRGKPAYQRTCPFYKILPGFSICVDAFRYGAVEGCKAYFLSHFHSDHYIGLTSSWCHGPIYCSRVTGNLVRRQLRVDPKWVIDLEFDEKIEVPGTQGVNVTMIPANHCPGSSLYLYEKVMGKGKNPKMQRVLHCGDFRACPTHVQHPLLRPDVIDRVTGKTTAQQKLDVCYLDTTYLTPKYAFPSQEEVIKACADMCVSLSKDKVDENDDWEQTKKERAGSGMVNFVRKDSKMIKEEADDEDTVSKGDGKRRGRLLVIVGTYSIGKERICLGVAKALNSKIYATSNKQKICAALEDPELMARLTNDPLEAQVHMQMLMEIRAETLADYLTGYKPHFSRIVGFRPSGWNYRPPNSRFTESPSVQTVLHSENWKSRYSMAELVPQRGSTREAHCFGVPYSEHSSFRELSMFCCALRIDKIIPTVNVGSAKSREKMKGWCEKWAMEKKKNGLFKVADGQTAWS